MNALCAGVQVDVYTREPQGALEQGVEGQNETRAQSSLLLAVTSIFEGQQVALLPSPKRPHPALLRMSGVSGQAGTCEDGQCSLLTSGMSLS